MSEPVKRRVLRITVFRSGALAGFLATVVSVVALDVWIQPYKPEYTVEVVSRGADVSRNGGASVVVRNGREGVVLRQTCRDGCDDFRLQAASGDNAVGVDVLDAQGHALTPPQPLEYVTGGYGAWITRFTVADTGGLSVRVTHLDHQPDGTFVETPWQTAPAAAPDVASSPGR